MEREHNPGSGTGEGSRRSSAQGTHPTDAGKRFGQSSKSQRSKKSGARGSASAPYPNGEQRGDDEDQEEEGPTAMTLMLDEMRGLRDDIRTALAGSSSGTALAGSSSNGQRRGPRGDQNRRDTYINDFHVRYFLLS